MTRQHIVVIGSGSLARAFVYSTATLSRQPTAVWLLARSPAAVDEIAYVGAARARLSGSPVTFHAAPVAAVRQADVERRLSAIGPDLVLHCAAHHSPWEAVDAPSPWTELLRRAGFGVTLPLQAALAIEVAGAAERAAPDALFLNACFPDAVNPVLAALGLPVLCGIGNVALLAASLAAALDLPGPSRLQVIAHHVHLHRPDGPGEEALAWRDGAALAGVADLLAPQRAAGRRELNQVTGHAGALLVRDLLEGAEVASSVPGPLGLPGGYPVRVRGRRLELRLPDGLTRAGAIAWNQAAAVRDGVRVTGSRVDFSEAVERELRPHVPELAAGFAVAEIADACRRLLELRDRLRSPATAAAPGGGQPCPIP